MKVKRYKMPNSHSNIWIKFKILCSYIYSYSLVGYIFVLLHSLTNRKTKYKYDVSLCLIFKNEAPFLKEWIEYHKLIGIDHFFLYNNLSDDDYMKVLKPYLMDGTITLTNWPKPYSQTEAYHDCYKKYRKESHWLGFIDTDEFLNINVKEGSDIKKLLIKYRLFPSLHIFWKMFGSSGLMKEDYSKPVIENYTSCWPWLTNEGKYFINNDWNFDKITIHWSKAKYLNFPIFPIFDSFVFTPFMYVFPICDLYKPKIYINHYWSKSREFSKFKNLKKGDAANKNNEQIRKANGIDYVELQCSDKDFSIQRWLIILKEKLNQLENFK